MGYEVEYMPTDKQYDGMLKDQIASLDRIAKVAKNKDNEILSAIYEERCLLISKLGNDVDEKGLYDSVKPKQ